MKSRFILAGALAAACVFTADVSAQPTEITGSLLGDRYSYWIVGDGGTRDLTPVFAFEQAPPPAPQFEFNYYDSLLIAQWEFTIPVELQGESLFVESAQLVVYNKNDVEWDPSTGEVHLFDAGFLPAGAFTESEWTENTAYVGPTSSLDADRNPFPVDLVTGTTAEDDPNATPWAVGVIDPSYTGNNPVDAFTITFDLDINNNTIQTTLQDDLSNGLSTWVIGSTFAASQPPAPITYPQLITKEGVGNTGYGTSQQAPALVLEVSTNTSVNNWALYQ